MDQPCKELPDEYVQYIRDEVSKSGISFSHLAEELIDHLCCVVEEQMGKGYTFGEAYELVKKNIELEMLKDVEIQTLILINKKFQSMKTTLKITGITGFILILIASVFKLNHWPGANIILSLSFLTFIFAYLPVLTFALRKEVPAKPKQKLILTGIFAAFFILISVLFTYMHWPYREYLIYIAWLFFAIFLVMLFGETLKSTENKVLNLSICFVRYIEMRENNPSNIY